MSRRSRFAGPRWRSAVVCTALLVGCLPAPSPAATQAPTTLSLTGPEYLRRKGDLAGHVVQVMHCHLEFAEVVPAFCSVYGPNGFADRLGHVVVDTVTMPRDVRLAGSALCPGLNQKPDCWVDLTGVPSERFNGGEVGTWLENPVVGWHRP